MGNTTAGLIDTYTTAFTTGDLAALEGCFHKDAAIIGTQDGLFVTADRSVYVGFLGGMGLGTSRTGKATVQKVWENRQGRIAVVCLVEELAGARTIAYATMLQTADGWKLISKSFVAQDAPETAALTADGSINRH